MEAGRSKRISPQKDEGRNGVIKRYGLPRMKKVWTDENRFKTWAEIEFLACEAQAKLGKVPEKAVQEIRAGGRIDVSRIEELEKTTNHEVIAFLQSLGENIGDASRYVHLGLTSSDIIDTGLALQMREAAEILIAGMEELAMALRKKAFEYKDTVMMGRTHGVHAEPTTLGLKLAIWVLETERNLRRLERAEEIISVGKISGAVGTYSNVDPFVEEYVCEKLDIEAAQVSSQILQRDRHAEYLTALALTASSLEKFATEIRHLQRTEVLEAEEPFREGQKGSSAMPHKRNPVIAERICGLARVIRSNSLAAMENVALWHERDISHSSVERVIIPDSTVLLDYIIHLFTDVVKEIVVYPDRMKENLEATHGLIFSQRVLISLVEAGLSRDDAYRLVQDKAMAVWDSGEDFKNMLLKDHAITKYLSFGEINDCFDYNHYLRHTDRIFNRLKLIPD